MWVFLPPLSVGTETRNRKDLRYLHAHVSISHSDGQPTSIDQETKEGMNLENRAQLTPNLQIETPRASRVVVARAADGDS